MTHPALTTRHATRLASGLLQIPRLASCEYQSVLDPQKPLALACRQPPEPLHHSTHTYRLQIFKERAGVPARAKLGCTDCKKHPAKRREVIQRLGVRINALAARTQAASQQSSGTNAPCSPAGLPQYHLVNFGAALERPRTVAQQPPGFSGEPIVTARSVLVVEKVRRGGCRHGVTHVAARVVQDTSRARVYMAVWRLRRSHL